MFPPVRGTARDGGRGQQLRGRGRLPDTEQGGNAVDAGVASVLAAAVTEQSRFGLGGEMPLLIKMAGKPVMAISGIGIAPAKATVDYYQHRQPEPWEEPDTWRRSRAGHSLGDHAGRVRRADSGAAAVRHDVVRAGGAAGDRICRAGLSDAEEFGNMLTATSDIIDLWPDSTNFFYPDGVVDEARRIVPRADAGEDSAGAGRRPRRRRTATGRRSWGRCAINFIQGSIAKRIADSTSRMAD